MERLSGSSHLCGTSTEYAERCTDALYSPLRT
jgi:hypothetical protein